MGGVLSIKVLKKRKEFIFHTVFIWVLYFVGFYVYMLALNSSVHISLREGLFVFAASGLAMAAPIQGGIGAYHWMVTEALILFGMPSVEGFVIATIIHTSSMALFFIIGGFSLIRIVLLKDKE